MLTHGLSLDDHCSGGGNPCWHAWEHQALRDKLANMGCNTLVAPTHAYPQGEKFQNLREAIYRQDRDRFELEMTDFNKLSQKEKDGLLSSAIFYHRRDNIKPLVENGADPNSLSYGETPLYLFFAESYPDDDELISFLRDWAKAGTAREEERQKRALEDYRSYENWYASLKGFSQEHEEGAPYYSEALYNYAVRYRAVDYFNILKSVVTDKVHEPKVERTHEDSRFRITRPYTGLSDRERIAIFEMIDNDGRYVVDKIELF